MDQGLGDGSVPPQPGPIDKSKVLDVKPLRFLVPVFPNQTGMPSVSNLQPSPFACVPPAGPFPNGVQPFYPCVVTNDSQHAAFRSLSQPGSFGAGLNVPAPAPVSSLRTPTSRRGIGRGKRGRPRSASKVTNM